MSEESKKAPLTLGQRLGQKVAIIAGVGLVLMIPLYLVLDVIQERTERARQVTREIAGKWGEAQTLRGPILLLPAEHPNPRNPSAPPTRRLIVLLPDDFEATAETTTETRSRGIFDAKIFTAKVRLTGRFDRRSIDDDLLDDDWRLRPDLATLILGVSDPRGLQEDLALTWDATSFTAEPGVPDAFLEMEGVHWPLQAFAGSDDADFEIAMTLRGSAALSVLPVGRDSRIAMAGNWPSPSFGGSALPRDQEIYDSGFTAEWNISHLSRSLPKSWNAAQSPELDWQAAVGVRFLDPVDFYRLSERSVKYGALFIALTFLVLFLFEVLLRRAVHPLQYLLVGAALVLFFLNLVAFAEVIGFAAAYAVSSLLVTGMISLYAAAVLRRRLWGSLLFAVTGALYALLFVILRMEEAAMLSGSLLLLAALAVTMFLTRRIDWQSPARPPARREVSDAAL
jgi:inner membrane protein